MLKWFKKAWFQLGTVLAIIGVIPTLFFIYDKYNIENVAAQQIRDKIYKEHREKILLENKINESEEPLKLSSMSGNTLSKSALALLYSLKGGVEEKRAKVIASKLIDDLEKFDEINIPDASFYLYYFYKYGVGVSVNNSISMNYLKKSANLKFPAAMYELGKQEETENLNSKGTLLIKSAANHGHIDAMALYGIIYYKDNGSISWLKKAAENGHAGSAMQLAKYDSIKNYRYWLKKASDNGSELATLKLVNEQLDNGDSSNINIMIDLASREHPYTPYAQYELGQYYKGKTNYSMWSKWNHMAAENNHPEALVEEGVYSLKNGRIDKAKSYFSKSKTIKTPGLYYHFGMINILTGDYKEAYYSLADAIRSESSYVKNKKKYTGDSCFALVILRFSKISEVKNARKGRILLEDCALKFRHDDSIYMLMRYYMIEDEVSYRDISDYFSQIRGEISNPMLSYLITVFFIQHAEVDSYCPNIVSLLDNYRNKLWVSDELKWIVRSETCKNFNTHEECCLNLKSSNLTVDETFILDLDYLKSDYLKMIKNYD